MLFTLIELFDIILMIFAAGFIFSKLMARPIPRINDDEPYDPLKQYKKKRSSFDWHNFWICCIVAGSALVLHEMGHKFAAMYFGMNATISAPYTWLLLAVVLVLIGSPLIFFVGGVTSFSCSQIAPSAYCVLQSVTANGITSTFWMPTNSSLAIIAFAGPFVNLVLWLGSWLLMSNKIFAKKNKKYLPILQLTKQINMILFIFNMLPIPGFDGWGVFSNLYYILF